MLKLSELNIITLPRNAGYNDLTITINYLGLVFSLKIAFMLVLPRTRGNGGTKTPERVGTLKKTIQGSHPLFVSKY